MSSVVLAQPPNHSLDASTALGVRFWWQRCGDRLGRAQRARAVSAAFEHLYEEVAAAQVRLVVATPGGLAVEQGAGAFEVTSCDEIPRGPPRGFRTPGMVRWQHRGSAAPSLGCVRAAAIEILGFGAPPERGRQIVPAQCEQFSARSTGGRRVAGAA